MRLGCRCTLCQPWVDRERAREQERRATPEKRRHKREIGARARAKRPTAIVRQWAIDNKYLNPDEKRGRLPLFVWEAYEKRTRKEARD
jgi:hypothetical protein